LVECKVKQYSQEWRKAYYLQQVRKALELFSKQYPSQTKEVWGSYLGSYAYSHRKEFRGRHIAEQAQFNMHTIEHAQFQVIVQEGKMAVVFLGMLSSAFWSTSSKG
jgi:hypothetical protein